jgi:hypothetical protein
MKLIKMALVNNRVRIKINNNFSKEFTIESGVKQEDPLFTTLFSILIDAILNSIDLRGNISTRLKQCAAYANDILITSRTEQCVVETFLELKEQSDKLRLIINLDKTKYLKCQKDRDYITVNEEHIHQVESFKYLGSLVNIKTVQ